MSLVGRTLGGRYKILSMLGKGGMGAVYEAEQTDLRRRVAVKVLTGNTETNDLLRFKQEALAAAGLAHPNIVQVIDFIDGDEPVLVMELLRGRSLAALVRSGGKLEPPRAVGIMTQVLSALAAAHDARIVHRDVKPENIFVCESALPYDLAKVLDFGLARPLDEVNHIARTRVGVAMGTPAYMAPEQARGASADVRMDVFAAGVTLYYALAGRRPFEGKTTTEILNAVKKQPPIPLDALCPELDLDIVRVVERSLSKDPDARFASARAFLEALTPHWPAHRVGADVPPPRSTRTRDAAATGGRKRAAFAIRPFELVVEPIAVGMAAVARFAPDGESALASGPAGLARWTHDAGWSSRALPPELPAALVRGFAFGANGEALVFGDARSTFVRSSSGYVRFDVPEHFIIEGAHLDHASHAAFAGAIEGAPIEGAIADAPPGGAAVHVIARGQTMHAITRVDGGALVACGARGTLAILVNRTLHAHVAGKSALRAIARLGAGFVAVGEGGALVFAARATTEALATATETAFADDDLVGVRTRAKFLCAFGRSVHVASESSLARPATAKIAGTIRDVWLGNGVVRVLLDTAAVLEAEITGGP